MSRRPRFFIKQGDTRPDVRATLYMGDEPLRLDDVSEVRIVIEDEGGTELVNEPIDVVEPTTGAVLFKDWTSAHTAVVGRHYGMFKVIYDDGDAITVPNDNRGYFVIISE